jgi:hypothetical protein
VPEPNAAQMRAKELLDLGAALESTKFNERFHALTCACILKAHRGIQRAGLF